jgi:hypothetical protein
MTDPGSMSCDRGRPGVYDAEYSEHRVNDK